MTDRMRVGFVVSDYPEVSETFISREVDFLQSTGNEVVVFRTAPRRNTIPAGRDGFPWIVDLNVGDHGRAGDISAVVRELTANVRNPLAAWRIARHGLIHRSPHYSRTAQLSRWLRVAKYELDLLHVHFARQLTPVLGIREALGVPLVISLWSTDGFDVIDLNSVCREANVLHAVSNFVATEFRKQVNLQERIEVIPPGIPCSVFDFDRQYRERTQYRILTVARLHWMKGVLYGIHVASQLKARGIRFVYDIVGEGAQRADCELAIRDLGLKDYVKLHGSKTPDQIPPFLREADIFLFPSVQETFGVALLEAQASGLPVVASRVGGISEAVNEPHSATLVPSRDISGMADAVEKLLRDPAARQVMGAKGKENVRKFDCELIGRRVLSMYEAALRAA